MPYYDFSGIYYLNDRVSTNVVALNAYTDEILDSMLSLSRFTSLVRWQFVSPWYRPVRAAMWPVIALKDGQGQRLPEDVWLWTAASDGTITLGWIVRDFTYQSLYSDQAVPLAAGDSRLWVCHNGKIM